MDGDIYLIWSYIVYGAVSVGLTIWLARTLFAHGAIFLEDVFDERPGMANSVNRLLVTGFYMLNLGYAFLILRSNVAPDALGAVETLITKLGILLVSLGVIHFVNMAVFWWIRNHRTKPQLPPYLPPPPPAKQQNGDPYPTTA